MFLENASQKGWIEVDLRVDVLGQDRGADPPPANAPNSPTSGSRFSNPAIDVRYSEEEVVSHDANAIRSTPVESPQNILLMTSDVDVVGIDEAQFFDERIVDVCRRRWPTTACG